MSEVLNLRFGWLNPIFLSHISAFLLLTLKFPCVCFLHSLFLRLNPNSCSWKSAKKKYYSVKSQLNSSICWLLYPQFTYKSVIFFPLLCPQFIIMCWLYPQLYHHQDTTFGWWITIKIHQNTIVALLVTIKIPFFVA
jgi:hypothetical protein